jgi:Protein of unknown function (DUF3618)
MSTPEPEPEMARLRAEIEQTREQLGETVQALTHKADVPARAREKLHDTRDAAEQKARQVAARAAATLPEPVRRRPIPVAAGSVFAVLLVILALRLWRRLH